MEIPRQHSLETNTGYHIHNIPIEILIEILIKLPVDSLVRFLLVCRSWHSLITSPSFITLHMHRSSSFPSNILVRPKKSFTYSSQPPRGFFSLLGDNGFVEYVKYRFPFRCTEENELVSIGNSCYGLLCLAFGVTRILGTKLFLYNPAANRLHITYSLAFPKDVLLGLADVFFSLGLGFCRTTDQHKIVRIGYITYNKATKLQKVPYEVEVHSLSTDSWRKIQAHVPCIADYVHHQPVTCNGAIHWLASRRADEVWDVIMAFHISSEVFSVIDLPAEHSPLTSGVLLVFEELLALFVKSPNGRAQEEIMNCCYEIWVMEEYNVTKSWTRQFHIETDSSIKKVFGFTQGGKLILQMDNDMVVSWDPRDQQLQDLGIDGEIYHVETCFTDSLVLIVKRKTIPLRMQITSSYRQI